MRLSVFLCCFVFATLNAQYMWQVKKDTIIKWYYYDGDEFNDSAYDSQKWTPAYSWSEVNYDLKYMMTPKRLVYDNGICHFMCYRDTGLFNIPYWTLDSSFVKRYKNDIVDGNKFKYFFTAGNLWSKAKYERGYFEIRFKSTNAYGIWPAFWLFGDEKDEIDFFELKGERCADIHVDIHCKKGCEHGYRGGSFLPKSFGGWIKSTNALNETYNVFAGEWQNGYIKWYLNGVGIAYFKGDLISKKMSLMIGTGPAEDGKGFAPGVNKSTVFPNSFDVDYVRVWYKDAVKKNELLGKVNNNFDFKPAPENKLAFLKRKIHYMYNSKKFKEDVFTLSVLPKKGKKIILSCSGKKINLDVTFYNENGTVLINKKVVDGFSEFDFNKLTEKKQVRMKINTAGRLIEEIIIFE